MQAHPIENIMKTTMEQITEMIDVNTIVGDAVEAQDGSVIIPVSRVSFGFVAGGAEYSVAGGREGGKDDFSMSDSQTAQAGEDLPFGGGAGAGQREPDGVSGGGRRTGKADAAGRGQHLRPDQRGPAGDRRDKGRVQELQGQKGGHHREPVLSSGQ